MNFRTLSHLLTGKLSFLAFWPKAPYPILSTTKEKVNFPRFRANAPMTKVMAGNLVFLLIHLAFRRSAVFGGFAADELL